MKRMEIFPYVYMGVGYGKDKSQQIQGQGEEKMDRMDKRLFADYSELIEMDAKVLVDIILTTRGILLEEMRKEA